MRYAYSRSRIRSLLLALCLLPAIASAADEAPEVELPGDVDVRFVVDVSGSMKRTDPNNLRRPAVSMVAELMPEGSQGGLWTFARYVNMLAAHGEVDDQWRREVRNAVSEIGSPGQYTNIGVALDTATQDFWPGGDYSDTHVVLLTDGMVDVPGGEDASGRERERILDEVVARFKKHGATLHTMALSQEADHSLLEQLALASGGQYTVAESDDQLTKAFLSAFDAASPTEEVPLTDNGFAIDDSVEEFTALIFRQKNAGPAELVSPRGERYLQDELPGDGRWYATDEYDLVTVKDPQSGRWEVEAIVGPDSRIKVVSKLRMAVNELPAHFYASDAPPVSVAFFEDGERLTDSDFLELLDVRVEIRDEEGGRRGTRRLGADEPPSNGIFQGKINTLGKPGRYEIRIVADGETFKRSQRQTVELRPPFDTEVQARGRGPESRYRFRVMPRDPGIDQDTVSVTAKVSPPEGSLLERRLEPVEGGSAWEWVLGGEQGQGIYRVILDIDAQMQNGRAIDLLMAPFEARIPRQEDGSNYLSLRSDTPEPEPAPEPRTLSKPDPEPEPEPLFDPEPVTPPPGTRESDDDDEETGAIPRWLWGGGALGFLLLVGGGIGFWFWRRRSDKDDEPERIEEIEQQSQPEPERSHEAAQEEDDGDFLSEGGEPELELQGEPDSAKVAEPEEVEEPEEALEIPDGEDPEAPTEERLEPDESIPTLDGGEAVTEPETSEEPEPEPTMESGAEENAADTAAQKETQEPEPDPEARADQILDENESEGSEEDDGEFSLEDFDISEFDDLPEQDEPVEPTKKDDGGDDSR